MNPTSIISRPVANYNDKALAKSIDEALTHFLDPATLTPTAKVVIKPNLLTNKVPEKAITTHPQVVQCVVDWLVAKGLQDITIAESGGGEYTTARLKNLYTACGMDQITGAQLNWDTTFQTVPSKYDNFEKNFNIITPIAQADIIINIAKLKTHVMATLTAGTKNMFGAVPGLQKPELHFKYPKAEDFCAMLVTLTKHIDPDVTIIDAIDCMEGDGPSGGTPRHFGYIFSAKNCSALDHFVAEAMGLPIDKIQMLTAARDMGFYNMEEMQVKGETPVASPPFKLPKTMSTQFVRDIPALVPVQHLMVKLATKFLRPVPQIKSNSCVGCGKCIEMCPAKTITMVSRKAKIDVSKCISCFCCHEICPVKAINMKRWFK